MTPAAMRQALLDELGQHPASIPMLGNAMARAGCPEAQKYFWARMAIKDALLDRACEEVTLHDGYIIFRLPANTPFEKPKDKP